MDNDRCSWTNELLEYNVTTWLASRYRTIIHGILQGSIILTVQYRITRLLPDSCNSGYLFKCESNIDVVWATWSQIMVDQIHSYFSPNKLRYIYMYIESSHGISMGSNMHVLTQINWAIALHIMSNKP